MQESNFDIDQWLLDEEANEEAQDMHFSLYSLPKGYTEYEY